MKFLKQVGFGKYLRITLSAEHLPGSKNLLADSASRVFDNSTEWSLRSGVYTRLSEKLG